MGNKYHHKHWGIEEKMPIVNALINDANKYHFYSKSLCIDRRLLRFWVDRYKRFGISGLENKKAKKYSKDEIFSILQYMENKKISLHHTSVEFNVSITAVTYWYNRYKSTGMYLEYKQEHKPMRKIKIPAINSNKRKVSLKNLSEQELRERIHYLEIENAYLKKLEALVQKRIMLESEKK